MTFKRHFFKIFYKADTQSLISLFYQEEYHSRNHFFTVSLWLHSRLQFIFQTAKTKLQEVWKSAIFCPIFWSAELAATEKKHLCPDVVSWKLKPAFSHRHHLQKSVVHQALGDLAAVVEETNGALDHTDMKWRPATKSVCKTAPKYRSILSTATVSTL